MDLYYRPSSDPRIVPEIQEAVARAGEINDQKRDPYFLYSLADLVMMKREDAHRLLDEAMAEVSDDQLCYFLEELATFSETRGGWYITDWHFENMDRWVDSPNAEHIFLASLERMSGKFLPHWEGYKEYPWFLPVMKKEIERAKPAEIRKLRIDGFAKLTEAQREALEPAVVDRIGDLRDFRIGYSFGVASRQSLIKNVESDPRLSEVGEIDLTGVDIPPELNTGRDRDNYRMYLLLARNLSERGLSVHEADLQAELDTLAQLRRDLGGLSVVHDRHVRILAHDEKWDGEDLFATPGLTEAISPLSKSFAVQKPGAEFFELTSLSASPRPFTFIFNGHGAEDLLELSRLGSSVSAYAFAEFVKGRQQGRIEQNEDIYILHCCKAQNFARTVMNLLPADMPKPLIIGAGEWGDYSYSMKSLEAGAYLWQSWIASDHEQRGTVGLLGQLDMRSWDGEPFIFAGGPGNQVYQIL